MKIRIKSDGTGRGTTIVDERGERLEMVTAVEWNMDSPNGRATAKVTFINVPVDVQAEVKKQGRNLE